MFTPWCKMPWLLKQKKKQKKKAKNKKRGTNFPQRNIAKLKL